MCVCVSSSPSAIVALERRQMLNDKAGIIPQGEEEAVTNRQTDDDGTERGEKFAKQKQKRNREPQQNRERRTNRSWLSLHGGSSRGEEDEKGDQRGDGRLHPDPIPIR